MPLLRVWIRGAVAFISLMLLAPRVHADDDMRFPTLPLGASAPDFKLPGVDGKIHALEDFAYAKLLVVVFTTNHCPTAQAYQERLKKLTADYRKRGVAVVAISPSDPASVRPDELGYTDVDDSLAGMKIRARTARFNFPYLYAGGEYQAFAKAYGPRATPHAFLFDRARKLRYVGRIDDSERAANVKTNDLRNAIDALLAGKSVEVAETKAFGCSTKWAEKAEQVAAYWERVKARPVTLEEADEATLRALRQGTPGVVRVINVWATWCGPCITEFPELVMTQLSFAHRDLELVTVAAQLPDEKDAVWRFLKKHHAIGRNYIFASEDKYRMIDALDPKWEGAVPYTLVVDPDGKVLYRKQGPIDFLAMRRALLPALDKTRPFGS